MKFIIRSLLILLVLYGVVFALGDMFLAHEHASQNRELSSRSKRSY